jgi:hypothetical protein
MSFMRCNCRDGWTAAALSVALSASMTAAAQAPAEAPTVAPAVAAAQEEPPESAAQDEKAKCIGAFDQAQVERAASRYLASQKQLLVCARPICGNALMAECTQMYTDIDRAIPSIVISAYDEADGVDLTAVEVTVDGQPFSQLLDGKPVPIDPGEYQFVFSVPGREPVRRTLVVGTGDKYRQVRVVFPASHPAPSPAPVASAQVDADVAPSGRGVPTMSYVLGGVGIAGFGAFATLRVIGKSDFDALKKRCAPSCTESEVSDVEQKYLLSNVALGVGAGATAGAILWYFLAPSASPPVAIAPSPSGQGVVASATGTF